jgi:dolichol-phosphate mannosyltransferase
MKVSVILPTYNESGNIVTLVKEILKVIPSDIEPEVIVVDDDSPDHTYSIAKDAFASNPFVRVLLRTQDRGFAKSIRYGIENAEGDSVLVMDTDFTHDPIEIPRLLHVGLFYDIVSGSRFCSGGNMKDRSHYLASLIYNWCLRIILRTQIQDNLGGYFTMKREKILQLPLDKIFYGYGEYFFRLIHFAQLRGVTIVEIPAQYLDRSAGKSKSNFLKMIFTYSMAAIRLKWEG